MDTITIRTQQREILQDVTLQIQDYLHVHGCTRGVLTLYSPHTTCAVTINEGCDPDVARDMIQVLGRLVPQTGDYRHAEGNSDAHVKTSLIGPSQQILVEEGRLCLGTWQRIFLAEFDGPRSRHLWVMWQGG
ncbi:secondary thiamine-phosphate synthase enzyme YjbQ [Desulfoplanes sp. PS50]